MPAIRPYLITGADGFLGQKVCRLFDQQHIPYVGLHKLKIDITDRAAVLRVARGKGGIVHLAGNVRTPASDTAERHLMINALGTLNLAAAADKFSIRRFIFASTSEVYDPADPRPKRTEQDQSTPTSFYGQSKVLAEHFLHEYQRQNGLRPIILRFPYLYGPGMHSSRVLSQLVSAGQTGRMLKLVVRPNEQLDLLHVHDAARAIVLATQAPPTVATTLNISTGQPIRFERIVRNIQRHSPGLRIQMKTVKTPGHFWYLDSRHAKQVLRFTPTIPIEAGLRTMMNTSA